MSNRAEYGFDERDSQAEKTSRVSVAYTTLRKSRTDARICNEVILALIDEPPISEHLKMKTELFYCFAVISFSAARNDCAEPGGCT